MIMWLLLLPTLLYAAGIALVAAWRFRVRDNESLPSNAVDLPFVAVLIAARNEEHTLGRCLEALARQDYPLDRFTVYVADDHSTDGTSDVIQEFVERPAGPRFVSVRVPNPTDHLRGKALAIHAGFERSVEPLLLMTDADCAPPPQWVRTVAGALSESVVGVVWAHTDVDIHSRPTLRHLHAVQALDWTYLLTAAGFLLSLGRPVTAMGNNMAFRRAAYDDAGGFPAIPFSVTEDFELFKAILSGGKWRARYLGGRASRVVTLPLDRSSEMYMQRRRWARGGLRAAPAVWIGYIVAHLAHLLPLVGVFVIPGATLLVLGAKLTADLALLVAATDGGTRRALRSFPTWQAYLFSYAVSLPYVLLVLPRIAWKDRQL